MIDNCNTNIINNNTQNQKNLFKYVKLIFYFKILKY